MNASPELITCEVGFVADGQRYQAKIKITPQQAAELDQQVDAVDEELRTKGGIQGFSFVPGMSDEISSTATELFETLHGAIGEYEEDVDWAAFKSACQNLDRQVAASSGQAVAMMVDFVWDNGGDDDNLFTQGYVGLPGNPAHDEVEHHLANLEEAGCIYDLSVQPMQPVSPDQHATRTEPNETQALLEWVQHRADLPVLEKFVRQARSFDASIYLDGKLGDGQSPRRGPRM